MPVKKKKRRKYGTAPKAKRAVSHFLESYEGTVRREGNNVFSKKFSDALIRELSSVFTPQKTVNIMKCLTNGARVVNKETFLSMYKFAIGDLGHDAWRDCEDDVLKFATKVIWLMQIRKGRGESEIDLSSVLFYLAYFKGWRDKEAKKWKLVQAAKAIAAASVAAKFNPYVIQIAHPSLVAPIGEALGLSNSKYYRSIVGAFIDTFEEVYNKEMCSGKRPTITFPKLKFLIPIEKNTREAQIIFLTRFFNLKKTEVKEAVKDIADLGTPSDELFIAIEKLKQIKGFFNKGVYESAVMQELTRIDRTEKFYSIYGLKDYHRYAVSPYARDSVENIMLYKMYKIEDCYIEKDSFLDDPFNEVLKMEIDCKDCRENEDIEPLIYSAAEILMTRIRKKAINTASEDTLITEYRDKLLITLVNVRMYTNVFATWVKGVEKKLCGQYNKHFNINICFESDTATSRFGDGSPEFIRVISDIHVDVNRDRNYSYDFGNDFVINCGDTGSNVDEAWGWVRSYMK